MDFSVGLEDLKDWKSLLKSLLAEFLGTLMLVLVGCGSALNWKTSTDVTQISLAFGLVVMAMVTVFGPVSGGHLNPGVSVGLLAGGELSLLKCVFYIIVQSLGAIIGAGLLFGVTPEAQRGTIGANALNSTRFALNSTDVGLKQAVAVHPGAGFVLEVLLTMTLVLVVYASAVDPKTKAAPGVAPILIGFTVSAAHLVLITYTDYGDDTEDIRRFQIFKKEQLELTNDLVVCKICSLTFPKRRHFNAERHLLNNHFGPDDQPCPDCGQFYKNKESLYMHRHDGYCPIAKKVA